VWAHAGTDAACLGQSVIVVDGDRKAAAEPVPDLRCQNTSGADDLSQTGEFVSLQAVGKTAKLPQQGGHGAEQSDAVTVEAVGHDQGVCPGGRWCEHNATSCVKTRYGWIAKPAHGMKIAEVKEHIFGLPAISSSHQGATAIEAAVREDHTFLAAAGPRGKENDRWIFGSDFPVGDGGSLAGVEPVRKTLRSTQGKIVGIIENDAGNSLCSLPELLVTRRIAKPDAGCHLVQ
jgi:hypothetical protein